ncbi:hypothetical protein [Streptomyces hokutonensis]
MAAVSVTAVTSTPYDRLGAAVREAAVAVGRVLDEPPRTGRP